MGKKFLFEAMAELNVYKYEPWDLAGLLLIMAFFVLFIDMGCLIFVDFGFVGWILDWVRLKEGNLGVGMFVIVVFCVILKIVMQLNRDK